MPAKHDPASDKARKKYNAEKRQILGVNAFPEEIESFKAACAENGTTATTEIRRFMAEYVRDNAKG